MDSTTLPSKTEFFVSSSTPAPSLGSAIARHILDGHTIVLRAVGASAVNQAVKAIIIAKGFTAPKGVRIIGHDDSFCTIESNGEVISAVAMNILVER